MQIENEVTIKSFQTSPNWKSESPWWQLKFTWQKNQNRLLIGNLNINSICSKFDQTKCLLKRKVDSLTITESKSDSSFTFTQFLIDGYSKSFRFDRNRNVAGVLLYVREDIVSRELKSGNLPIDIGKIFIELNLRKVKWLFFQLAILLLNLRTTIFLLLAIALMISVPHVIHSYWLAILMLIIPNKLCSTFFRSITLQTL